MQRKKNPNPMFLFYFIFYCIFHFGPLYPSLPHNHPTVVHIHESFFHVFLINNIDLTW